MAKANTISDAEIPLIEEHVETGLQQLLDSYRTSYVPGGDKKDELGGRFTFYPSRPLPEFNHTYAKGYEAVDDFNTARPVYAMVCEGPVPPRTMAINDLTGFVHPAISTLLGAGTVNCSHLGESRMVLFIERPRGTRLKDIIKTHGRLHEHKVLDTILQPIAKVLVAMREKKLSHGHIHPGNVFMSDAAMLGECSSALCGTQHHYIYEPLERLMADPLGRGEASEKSDVYALGILAFELMYGLDKIKAIPREQFIEKAISLGTYQLFAENREYSDALQDFFRGILNENPAERWGLEQLMQWIGGKRFNMIAPNTPKEALRPITFHDEAFFSRRRLANSFHVHWREALKDIKALRVDRWCEMSLHRPELAEKMERVLRTGGHASTEAQMNDMLTRVICLLDPIGPLRTSSLSIRPDALGAVLAETIDHGGPELAQVVRFIENDFPTFWADQSESNKNPEISILMWRLERVRPYLKKKGVGFGLERVLYDLNPSLACQSPLLKAYHVTTAVDALKTLDAIAVQMAPDTSFVDRHLAAFIASRIEMGKEIRIPDLASVPALANNQELAVLHLLAKAQQKVARLALPGLCSWAAMRIEKMINEIHNRIIRKRLKLQLKGLAQSGNLYDVLTAIINIEVSQRDHEGFARAIALHQINTDRMDLLKNDQILDYKSRRAGGKMASVITFAALVITSYITIFNIYGL
ncbi:MAG: protein kinase [Pseudomonadota bacterium]